MLILISIAKFFGTPTFLCHSYRREKFSSMTFFHLDMYAMFVLVSDKFQILDFTWLIMCIKLCRTWSHVVVVIEVTYYY